MSVIRERDVPLFKACAEHGLDLRRNCWTCRLVIQPGINKALSATPCDCGEPSEFFWQSPNNRSEFNATCEVHTPPFLLRQSEVTA